MKCNDDDDYFAYPSVSKKEENGDERGNKSERTRTLWQKEKLSFLQQKKIKRLKD